MANIANALRRDPSRLPRTPPSPCPEKRGSLLWWSWLDPKTQWRRDRSNWLKPREDAVHDDIAEPLLRPTSKQLAMASIRASRSNC